MLSNLVQKTLALILFILATPFLLLSWIIMKLEDGGPLLFKQKRMGKNGRIFTLYKLRSMVVGAEDLKSKYSHLDESDGPVFKIKNDPRHTRYGRFLAKTGLDEVPQLINVLKGEMSLVGPRPLPVAEAEKIPKKYKKRHDVLPGITSLWVVRGAHGLSFKKWMELDLEYMEKRSLLFDSLIALRTLRLMLRSVIDKGVKKIEKSPKNRF